MICVLLLAASSLSSVHISMAIHDLSTSIYMHGIYAIPEMLTGTMVVSLLAIFINTAVYVMWWFPQLNKFMDTYFTHSIDHPLYALVLSTFSHETWIELLGTNLSLILFAGLTWNIISWQEYILIYVSGAVVSASASIVYGEMFGFHVNRFDGSWAAINALMGYLCGLGSHKKFFILAPHFECTTCQLTPCFLIACDALHDFFWMMLHIGHEDYIAFLSGASYGFLIGKYLSFRQNSVN